MICTHAPSLSVFQNQVRVTYDDEPGPEGFERVSRDLAKGGTSGRRAFLWLKRQQSQQETSSTPDPCRRNSSSGNNDSDGARSATAETLVPSCAAAPTPSATDDLDAQPESPQQSAAETIAPLPIGEVVVAFGSSDPNVEEAEIARQQERGGASEDGGEGKGSVRVWERLERSLDPAAAVVVVERDHGGEPQGGAAVFLWYRRGSEDDSGSWSSHSLKVRAFFTEVVGSMSGTSQTHLCVCTIIGAMI